MRDALNGSDTASSFSLGSLHVITSLQVRSSTDDSAYGRVSQDSDLIRTIYTCSVHLTSCSSQHQANPVQYRLHIVLTVVVIGFGVILRIAQTAQTQSVLIEAWGVDTEKSLPTRLSLPHVILHQWRDRAEDPCQPY